ncbi:MAG: hypothetical protein IPJ74_13100 [Saprospiraceae bacterium]|nr:hypothetical protein [Saprospiraceae bacterium]
MDFYSDGEGTASKRTNVLKGITSTNTIWGHTWDGKASTGNLSVRGMEGLEVASFTIVNT